MKLTHSCSKLDGIAARSLSDGSQRLELNVHWLQWFVSVALGALIALAYWFHVASLASFGFII